MSSLPKLRLAFMGTPDFAVPVLQALMEAGHHVVSVYSQPPKPAGRGHPLQKTPVHRAAEALGIPVRTPKTLRDEEEQKLFAIDRLDAAVVVAYGLILPLAVLQAPRLGCLNIHFSLLPRWRGAAPVARAMLAGDAETGICIMQMDEGLDTGPVLLREAMPIQAAVSAPQLLDALTARGAALVLQALAGRKDGSLKAVPQAEAGATYAAKLTKEDGRIDWSQTAEKIERQIRALQPWPGCFFLLGQEPIKLLDAEVAPHFSGAAGTLLKDDFTVACGQGALCLKRLQRAGKNPTDGASFLRGARLPLGTHL